MVLELTALRIYFDAGDLVEAQVLPAPMEKGWMLLFTRKNGVEVFLTRKRSDKPKVMKSLDTVQNTLAEIGFQSANWRVAS